MHMKKQQPPRGNEPPVLDTKPARKARRFTVLQGAMSLGLPVLFLLGLLLSSPLLRWAFIIAAAVCVLMMWVLGAFVKSARCTLSLIYGVLAVVIGVALAVSQPDARTQRTVAKVDTSSLFSAGSALDSPTLSDVEAESTSPEETPVPVSAAQQKLMEFMGYWAENNTEKMLTVCSPDWIAQQASPATALFNTLGLNRPTSYQVEQVYGNESEASRTIQMVVNIEKGNGEQLSKRYQILMVRLNDVWYIKPESLSSIGNVSATDEPFGQVNSILTNATPTPSPAPTVNPSTTLYYNPDGGSYYHADKNCSRVNAKYLPLSGTFLYADINNSPYKNLQPCSYCKAPARPAAQ